MSTRRIGRVLPGTPRTQALLFRVWQFAEPRGWDATASEIAEAIGESSARVLRCTAMAGWASRLRTNPKDGSNYVHGKVSAHAGEVSDVIKELSYHAISIEE